ncbi:UNVERIFIED_CONTAM: Protein GrpE [Sesamum indicum]
MATTVLKTPPTFSVPAAYLCSTAAAGSTLKSHNLACVSFIPSRLPVARCRIHHTSYKRSSAKLPSRSAHKFLTFAADGETAEAQTETQEKDAVQGSESEPEIEVVLNVLDELLILADAFLVRKIWLNCKVIFSFVIMPEVALHRKIAHHDKVATLSYAVPEMRKESKTLALISWIETLPEGLGNTDGALDDDTSSESDNAVAGEPSSVVVASLNLYKEALANNDESKVAEVESFLKSIEDEKIGLERKVATLSEELSSERDRVLRISADFDNFRKRTERERLSLVTNAQGEVVESLLSVLDNFERAKAQIKVETEGEEKINNSYQSIYKQFSEILGSLGVVPVETVGKPFDPMLHEAIMREDSTEYEDGIIIEEYRKGFLLGERLLRPSMVKVSAGPGPAKPETGGQSEVQEEVNENGGGEGSSETTGPEE